MRRPEFEFANDIRHAADIRVPRTSRLLISVSLALIVTLVVWAHFAIIDEVTRGTSRVVPSRQTQVVQSLEGGLVETIGVQEGAVVAAGQTLMRIDATNFSAQLGEIRERRAALAARVARLEAEAGGAAGMARDASTPPEFAHFFAAEEGLFRARQLKLNQDIEVLSQQEEQKRRELEELKAQERRLSASLALLEREVTLTRRLFRERVVPEVEMLRLERQFAETTGQLDVVRVSFVRAEGAIREAQGRSANVVSTFRASAREELVKSRGDLGVLEETIKSAQDRVRRTDLRSPVHGIINKIHVTTLGAVVQPAQNVIEIVPLDDSLLVEAQVRPSDIAFIRPGQPAVVKITAYDAAVFGSLPGRVERISADTTTTQQGDTYYRVIVRTDKNHLGPEAAPLPILPGMIGTAEILTGRKSVLSYLLKPVTRVANEALRER